MPDVFISYSRSDRTFVRKLHRALSDQNLDTWVDWEDIPPTAEFLQEIYAAIEGTNTFVFMISPNSVASVVCRQEIAHAVKHNKRLVPVKLHEVADSAIPETLRIINWIDAREYYDFPSFFARLIEVINTDLDWVKAHTRLLTRAIEWDNKQRNKSFLLRGSDLKEAEQGLAKNGQKDPQPTDLQREYASESRKATTKRQRVTGGVVVFGLIIAIGLGVLAWGLRKERELQRSQTFVNQAQSATGEFKLLAAVMAIRTTDGIGEPPLLEAEQILFDALVSMRGIPRFEPRKTSDRFASVGDRASKLGFGSEDRRWLYGVTQAGIRRWEIEVIRRNMFQSISTEDAMGKPIELPDFNSNSPVVVFSPDGRWLADVSQNVTVRVWRLEQSVISSSPLWELESDHNQKILMNFSSDGRWFAVAEGKSIHVLDLNESVPSLFFQVETTDDDEVEALAIGTHEEIQPVLATAKRNGVVSLWEISGKNPGTPRRLLEQGSNVKTLGFSPNGCWLVAGVHLWNLCSMTSDAIPEPILLPANVQRVDTVAFSPDSHWLVTGGNSGTSTSADLWNLTAILPSVPTAPIILHHPPKNSSYDRDANLYRERTQVRATAFSPDGRWLATAMASYPNEIWLWPMRMQDRIIRACQILQADLKETEEYNDACQSM